MLLNQIRSEDGDPETCSVILSINFKRTEPFLILKNKKKSLKMMIIEGENSLKNYCSLLEQYKTLKKDVRDIVLSPKHCLPFLHPGRLMLISKDANKKPEDSSYMVDVLTRCRMQKDALAKKTIRIIPLMSLNDFLSSIQIIIPKDLVPVKDRENILKKVYEVLNRFVKEGTPLLDFEDDMKVQSSSYRKAARRIEMLENLFEKHEIAKSPLIEQKLKVLHTRT